MKIYTLGNFDIQIDDKSILETKGYPYKTTKLFKYFVTFKGKRLLPENIIEDLWSDNDSTDPKNVLRTQISRVRNMINTEEHKIEEFYQISHKNGYYVFEIKNDCLIDVELFEANMIKGNELKLRNPIEALKILKEGIELYKGQYLQEMEYEEWIVPIRNRYHRLYLQGLMNCIDILKQRNMNKEIVKICEEAIQHEPYGEKLHIEFIEALLTIGEKRYAINHYEYITSKLYSHLGIPPSQKMKALYKRLQIDERDVSNTITLNNIEDELENRDEKQGPVFCDPDYFKLLYYLETKKRDTLTKKDKFLFIVTIYSKGYKSISEEYIQKGMSTLINIAYNNLRQGDVLARWNESQIICLLYGVEEESLEMISNRLNNKFEEEIGNKDIILNIMFKPI